MTSDYQLYIDDDCGQTQIVLPEILSIFAETWPENDFTSFIQCYHYVTDFFTGKHPDFPESILPYHNLRHTRIVTLATARLFHGMFRQGKKITAEEVERGLICSLFHDTGLLEMVPDNQIGQENFQEEGAAERQSARILRAYLQELGIEKNLSEECSAILTFTNINIAPQDIECSDSARKIGYVLGSTDIISQMADRYYLECLPLLYTEMVLGEHCQFSSLFDLFQKTTSFYSAMHKRLKNDLGGVYKDFSAHFLHTTGKAQNLYMDRIEGNLKYLRVVLEDYDEERLEQVLRRTPPTLNE